MKDHEIEMVYDVPKILKQIKDGTFEQDQCCFETAILLDLETAGYIIVADDWSVTFTEKGKQRITNK